MEMVTIQCSHCKAKMKVKNLSIIGKKAKCPKCSKIFVVQPILTPERNIKTALKDEIQENSRHNPPQKKEDFLLSQRLWQEQQNILCYFKQIMTEYTLLEKNAHVELKRKTQNLKQEFERLQNQLKMKLEQVTFRFEKVKSLLQGKFATVIQNASVNKNSMIDNDGQNAEKNLSLYVECADQVVKEMEKFSRSPFPIEAIGTILFIALWSILGAFMNNGDGGFIIALITAPTFSALIYYNRNRQRAKPYGKILQVQYDAERIYKLALEQSSKRYADKINLVNNHYENSIQSARQDFEKKMSRVYQFCTQSKMQVDNFSPEWTNKIWQKFTPTETVPSIIRMGEFISGRWEYSNNRNSNKTDEEAVVDLKNIFIKPSLSEIVSEKVAKKYKIIPIGLVGRNLKIAIAESNNIYSAIDELIFITGYHIEWIVASEKDIFDAIDLYYGTDLSKKPKKEPIDYKFSMPALFPFPGNQALFFKVNDLGKNIIAQQLQALLLRLLAMIPPAKLRFTFIDPVALGHNVAPFMHLADHDESLVTSKSWSEPRHIEQRLEELAEHMEIVIQKYLRNTYASIEEFNQKAGEVAEAYRFLVVLNFPVNFSDDAARRLVSIVQNGPRCGVHTIILYDSEQPLPHGFNVNDLEHHSMVVSWDGSQLIWKESKDSNKCILKLEDPPDNEIFKTIINKVGKASIEASKVEVPFEKILEKSQILPERWWTGSTENGVQTPLGPIGANKIQYLDLGKGTAQHVLIAGKTGSGKSTLLHVLISTLTLNYSPDEVELYLIDFKKGVEFKTYAAHQLPHARVIAIESEREFGLSVLEGLDAELKRRGDVFRTAEVDGLKKYRRKTKQKIPRIFLLVDEFQEFFTEDDVISSKVSQILDRLVRQGRAFGIHVLLGSQTLAGAYTLARSTIDQMAIRIALQCSEADSRLILSDDNPAARLLSRPGEAIYNSANGLIEGNNPFQVAWLPADKHDLYLDKVKELSQQRGLFPPKNQIVFEGNAPADAERAQALNAFLTNLKWDEALRRFPAWLGEPIAIKDATSASFRHQAGSNLLIIGQNDEAAMGVMMTSVLTLAAQHSPQSIRFYLIDFGSVDGPHADFLKSLSNVLPHTVKYSRRRQLPNMINEIAQEVEKRLEHEDESLQRKSIIYLVIYGLQRARDLEQEDSFGGGFTFDANETPASPEPSKQFPKILREGPDLGIHTIAYCDTYTNLNRRLSRQVLREFEMRVVFQMGNEDSMNLIDSPAAGKLGQHRALYYSEEDGILEKFRPFALPQESWLKKIGENMKKIVGQVEK